MAHLLDVDLIPLREKLAELLTVVGASREEVGIAHQELREEVRSSLPDNHSPSRKGLSPFIRRTMNMSPSIRVPEASYKRNEKMKRIAC